MAKTSGQTLISDLAKRLDLDSTDSTVRADMLRQLNISQQAVLQDHSLAFLNTNGTVSLLSAASSAAMPTTLDAGKLFSLGRAGSDGEIEYVSPDQWFRTRLNTYRSATQTGPSYFTVAQVAGVTTIQFKPSNTSGGTLALPYMGQLVPVAIADTSGSTSMLPEGWEDTLLLDHAEGELMRFQNESGWEAVTARANDKKERLYASYRTSKEQSMTDREQKERKIATETLAPEKP